MAEQWNTAFQNWASELEGDEWTLELDDSIVPDKPQKGWFQYIRKAFAQFRCSLCKRSWPSKRVQVVFHFTLNSSLHRGTVKVRGFKQKCRRCTTAQMEAPSFLSENIDILLEKLMERIRIRCYKEERPETNKNLYFKGRVEGPHEAQHCEACLKGFCNKNN
ncbi:receptor-transporting protein 3-like [Astyanax mexicanus]|uniref:receptor-transporting protein 3-like n=1 Tax=Astyanax mexicanus TaxID=7994 RepID=UPI0020CAC094|nr:receptor-transporting protein 3-like [Astyanax mexicanus]